MHSTGMSTVQQVIIEGYSIEGWRDVQYGVAGG